VIKSAPPAEIANLFSRKEKIVNQNEITEIFARTGAIITNSHIVYTSGKHGSAYVNKDAVYPHISAISALCREIALQFERDWVDAVIAPAVGGVILSTRVAEHLSVKYEKEVLGVYADKDGDNFVIKRGYDKLIKGKRVLVVEDVLTTGGSAKKVVEAVRVCSGYVVGLGVLCNRGGIKPEDVGDTPKLFALVNVHMDAWDEAECPLCKAGVPINTDVGKGREFLAKQQKP